MNRLTFAAIALLSLSAPALADTTSLTPDLIEFRALYKELVETNTTLSFRSRHLAPAGSHEGPGPRGGPTPPPLARSHAPFRLTPRTGFASLAPR